MQINHLHITYVKYVCDYNTMLYHDVKNSWLNMCACMPIDLDDVLQLNVIIIAVNVYTLYAQALVMNTVLAVSEITSLWSS